VALSAPLGDRYSSGMDCALTDTHSTIAMWTSWALAVAAGATVWGLLNQKAEARWAAIGKDSNRRRFGQCGALLAGVIVFAIVMVKALEAWRAFFCG
jgi:hypothetical protein